MEDNTEQEVKRTSVTYTMENYEYLKGFAYKSKNISDKVNAIIEEHRTTRSILDNYTKELLDKVLDNVSDRIDITGMIDQLLKAADNVDSSAARLAIDSEMISKIEMEKTKNWILYLHGIGKADLLDLDGFETQQALKQLIEEQKLEYVAPDEYALSSSALEQLSS